MHPLLFMHVLAATAEQMLTASNGRTKNLLAAPKAPGYYYEMPDDSEFFAIIKHTSQNPHKALKGAFYAGPIDAYKFLDLFLQPTPLFIGCVTNKAIEVIIKKPDQDMQKILTDIRDRQISDEFNTENEEVRVSLH